MEIYIVRHATAPRGAVAQLGVDEFQGWIELEDDFPPKELM